jgi:hypothetical protein
VSSFSVGSDTTFTAQLRIYTTLTVRHYRWEIDDTSKRCVFSYTETRSDVVTVSDSLAAKLHAPSMNVNIALINTENGGVEILPTVNDAVRYDLAVGNATYSVLSKELVPTLGNAPYYPLTYNVQSIEKVIASNIRYGDEGIIVVPGPCEFTLYDYFTIRKQSCTIPRNADNITLSTDKSSYLAGEPIRVKTNVPSTITYAGSVVIGSEATFHATRGNSFIEARTAGQEAWTAVSVDSGAWGEVLNALLAAPVAFVLWRASRFALGGVL